MIQDVIFSATAHNQPQKLVQALHPTLWYKIGIIIPKLRDGLCLLPSDCGITFAHMLICVV